MSETTAAYMLLFRETTPEAYEAMTPEQRRRSMDEWNAWRDRLDAEGRYLAGHPLEDGRRIVAATGTGTVTDGPFAEAKELVAGYFLVAADSLDEAEEIARACPNLKHGMRVEVRPVAGACHVAKSLGWETMRAPAEA